MIAHEGAIFNSLGSNPTYKAPNPSYLTISFMNFSIDLSDAAVNELLFVGSLLICNLVLPTSNGLVKTAAIEPEIDPLRNELKNKS
jgi:hypothetical protein